MLYLTSFHTILDMMHYVCDMYSCNCRLCLICAKLFISVQCIIQDVVLILCEVQFVSGVHNRPRLLIGAVDFLWLICNVVSPYVMSEQYVVPLLLYICQSVTVFKSKKTVLFHALESVSNMTTVINLPLKSAQAQFTKPYGFFTFLQLSILGQRRFSCLATV